MQKFRTLADAVALAEFAHRNQVDKAGLPYIEHPRRVMQSVQAQGGLPYEQMAAILHDITEDTAFTPDMLLTLGVPEGAVAIISLLDRGYSRLRFQNNFGHPSDYSQWAWYKEEDEVKEATETYYYEQIRLNPSATRVKLADINDNLQEWRLSYLPEATQARLREKYAKAKRLLGVA